MVESGQPTGRIIANPRAPSKTKPSINYILSGSTDDQYRSKQQQKRLVRVATVKAKVNFVHIESCQREVEPIDDPISFPLVNPNSVMTPEPGPTQMESLN